MSTVHTAITPCGIPSYNDSHTEYPLEPLYQGALPGTNILVSSSPVDASIYLDDIYEGETFTEIKNVTEGAHIITLKLVGYDDWSHKIIVPDVEGNFRMSPTLTPKSVRVQTLASPNLLQNPTLISSIASLITAIVGLISTFFGMFIYFKGNKNTNKNA